MSTTLAGGCEVAFGDGHVIQRCAHLQSVSLSGMVAKDESIQKQMVQPLGAW